MRVVTTYWSNKLKKLVCITQYPISLSNNDTIQFLNSSNEELNKVLEVSHIITDTAFAVNLQISDNFEALR